MPLIPRHFLRMARWARNPPGEARVKLVLVVIALALAIWGLEQLFGTPDWMQIERVRPGRNAR